jgi:hypothetical protein
MIKLKAEGIRNLQDARFCSAEGIDFLVFRFEQGYDFRMPAEMIRDIAGWLSGTGIILQIGTDYADTLQQLPADFAIAGVQSEIPEALAHPDFKGLIKIYSGMPLPAADYQYQVAASEYTADMQQLPIWVLIEHKDEMPAGMHPYGISLGTGFQDADGELDYDRVSEVLDLIRSMETAG